MVTKTRGYVNTIELLKNPLVQFVLAVYAVLAPIHPVLYTVIALKLTDIIFGTMASFKRGVPFSSAKFYHAFLQLFIYLVTLCISFSVETYVLKFLPLVKIMATLVTIRELTSLYENAGIITGEPLFAVLVKKLESKNKTKGE